MKSTYLKKLRAIKIGNITHNDSNHRLNHRYHKQPAALIGQYTDKLHLISIAVKHPRRIAGNRLKRIFSAVNSFYTMVFCWDIWDKTAVNHSNTHNTAVCTGIRW